jgi:RNA recognition motif-containing protein
MRADVVLGPDGRSRGFGTVVFATELDAERALKMFNGYFLFLFQGVSVNAIHRYEFNGRVLNVHRDKYSLSGQPENTPGNPSHITLPPGYMIDLLPSSKPPSPRELVKYQHHLHDQQQLQPQLQQYQHHHHPQQRNLLPDLDNLPDTLSSPIPKSSSTQFHQPSSSSSSRPSSTSIPITTKHPIPIPIYKPPPFSHTNTTSSGSDRSEIFSRLSSASATSAATSVSSRPQSQGPGYPYGQVTGQRARGQPFQTSSPHLVSSSPDSPHPRSHSSSQHCSSSSSHSSSSPRASQSSSYTTSACRSSSRPPSYYHRHPQHPGSISLPPPHLAFNIPLQQLSPHGHTPLGMSVSVSVSPLVEYPGGFGYESGMYGQHQQHQQHMMQTTTPHGLNITPSMPSFTFLPSAMPSGSHVTPTGRVGSGAVNSSTGGHRQTRTRSKYLARQLEMEGGDEDEHARNNPPLSVNGSTSSASPSPSSAARQRHPHHQQHHHHQNQQSNQVRLLYFLKNISHHPNR